MPNEINEKINEKLEDIFTGVKKAQDVADKNSERLDTLDKEQIKKITDDICDNVQKVQDLQAKQKEIEENEKKLETIICNLDNVKKSSNAEDEKLARDDFTKYLREKTPMSEKSVEFITRTMVDKGLIGIEDDKKEIIRKDLQVQVNPDGGYWVRPEISNLTIQRIFESSPVRQFAGGTTINSDALEMIIDDQELPDGGWVGETDSRPTTGTPQIGKLVIYAHELYAQPRATQKMLDDAGFDIEAWLQGKIVRKMTRLENRAFVVGNGHKKPRGFLDYPAWAVQGTYETGKIEQRPSTASGDFEGDDLKNLQNDLIEDYQPKAIWMMRRATFGKVVTKKDGEDRYLLDPNSFKTGDTKILLGSQVVFMHDMPAVASDALAIAYGDLGVAYLVVDRIGIRVIRDNMTEKPFILYYTTKRVGGDVINYQALKILKLAS